MQNKTQNVCFLTDNLTFMRCNYRVTPVYLINEIMAEGTTA